MHVYIYQAALLCMGCGDAVIAKQLAEGKVQDGDSDHCPQGPYGNGGGEADCPQHCDKCRVFLKNPLTNDGMNYVREALDDNDGDAAVLAEWKEFYGL